MYISESDPTRSLAVWVFGSATAPEWEHHFEELREVATWSEKTGCRAAALLINKTFDMPAAELRAKLTEHTALPGYDPYVAFVAANRTMMTVLTLFSWFQKRPRYEIQFVSSVEAGIVWLEHKRGEKLPVLRALAKTAERRAAEGGGRAAG